MSYKLDQQPWIRDHRGRNFLVCPFCGDATLELSVRDLRLRNHRHCLELYCDNPECDVRTMAVVALRVGVPNRRAELGNL